MHVPLTEVILSHEGVELVRATLAPGEYVIGREPGADLYAATPLLSRRHARLTVHDDHLLLEDLGSSNGTFVNDQPVTEPTRVFADQSIRLGPNLVLEIQSQQPSSESRVSLAPAQAALQQQLPPELLAEQRYSTGNVIARGGMGAILDARQNATRRTVAMKVMLESGTAADILRFVEEAQVTAQLDHPNIVPIYELGVDERGQVFYSMKMVRGITLKKVLELLAHGVSETAKKYPLPILLTVFQKVCDAIAFAHSKGVLHRDLKPENIMLGDFGSVLVMDSGLAKVIGQKHAIGTDVAPDTVTSARAAEPIFGSTMAGAIMGTPAYMSPEQARGETRELDARSDIYALGAILFEIVHLRPAVTGSGAMAIVAKVQRGEVEWTGRAGVPPADSGVSQESGRRRQHSTVPEGLLAVCRQALAPDPERRYTTVEALQADLLAYQNGFATSAEKAGAWKQLRLLIKRQKTAAIGLAAVLVVGAGFGTKALVAGRRAEREAAISKAALADLKRSAPSLLALAESEAGFQRFESALAKFDTALVLDPGLLPAYWRRAWLLLGMERWSEAADAIRLSKQRDPVNTGLAGILPVVERIAASHRDAAGVDKTDATLLLQHLQTVGASGTIIALTQKLGMSREERVKLVQARVEAWLGTSNGWLASVNPQNCLDLAFFNPLFTTLAPLKGLPIENLDLGGAKVDSLEPLRDMPLNTLGLGNTGISDISPLSGMMLTGLTTVGCPISDFSPLRGAPLRYLAAPDTRLHDLSFLAESPIEVLVIGRTAVEDLGVLKGKPLQILDLAGTQVRDLTPLIGAPLRELSIAHIPPRFDLSILLKFPQLEKLTFTDDSTNFESLRHHPSLKFIQRGEVFGRPGDMLPVAEFWANYDAPGAAETNTPAKSLERLLAEQSKMVPDGIRVLDLQGQNLPDLSPLKGLKLTSLNLDNTHVADLTPLHGMPIRVLSLRETPVSDLTPLLGMPLQKLYLSRSQVTDLSPLRGSPLEELSFVNTSVSDVRPLLSMTRLRNVMLPRVATNIEILRPLKNLQYLGWDDDWDTNSKRSKLTAAEFWARFDAQQKAGTK